jgi:hypothetical protein
VERYFGGLYTRIFDQTSAFAGIVPGHWTDDLEDSLASPIS